MKKISVKARVLWEACDVPYPKGDAVVELPGGHVKFFGAFLGRYYNKPYYKYDEIIPGNVIDKIGCVNPFV